MSGTEIDIEWVRTIANETAGTIASDASTSTATFRNSTLAATHVGTLPVSLEYAAQVGAAHAFFVETIQGVVADLQVFATNLKASADAHDTNDGNAAAALRAFDTTYEEHDYQSAPEHQESAYDDALAVPEEALAAAADQGAEPAASPATDLVSGPGEGSDAAPAPSGGPSGYQGAP